MIALFVLMGITTGSWAARIPGVRDQLHISDAQWGLANVGATAGSLVSLIVVMAVVVRTGPRRLALTGGSLLLITAPLAAGAVTYTGRQLTGQPASISASRSAVFQFRMVTATPSLRVQSMVPNGDFSTPCGHHR